MMLLAVAGGGRVRCPAGGAGSRAGSAAAVGGLDLVDIDVAGPVDRVEDGAGDRVARGGRRPVLDANGPAGPPGQRSGDVPLAGLAEGDAAVRGGVCAGIGARPRGAG